MRRRAREVLGFLAGAQAFHVLTHLYFAFVRPFPLDLGFFVLTEGFNRWAIGYNFIILLVLLYFAYWREER